MKTDLTQEQVRAIFDYDGENGWLIRKKDEYGRVVNRPCGHKPNRSHGYGAVRVDKKMYLAHRVIWLWHKGELPKNRIDHIDRNKMNNRLENLRAVSPSENQHNHSLRRNNSSGFPGVHFNKQCNKYYAQICKENKRIFIGSCATAEEAFEAYKRAKIKFHPTSPIAQEYIKELGL